MEKRNFNFNFNFIQRALVLEEDHYHYDYAPAKSQTIIDQCIAISGFCGEFTDVIPVYLFFVFCPAVAKESDDDSDTENVKCDSLGFGRNY